MKSIVIARLKKKFLFDECPCFVCLRTQNKKNPSVYLSVCLYVCTDMQTDRHTDRCTVCMFVHYTVMKSDRHTDRCTIQTDRQTDRHTYIKTDGRTDGRNFLSYKTYKTWAFIKRFFFQSYDHNIFSLCTSVCLYILSHVCRCVPSVCRTTFEGVSRFK